MNMNHEKIYDDYRNSDFTSRLHIFLRFPELREDFLEIDQKETKTEFFKADRPPTKNHKGLGKLLNRLFSFF